MRCTTENKIAEVGESIGEGAFKGDFSADM